MTAKTPVEAVEGAHAIAVLTEWDEFKTYDYEAIYEKMAKPVRDPACRVLVGLCAWPGIKIAYMHRWQAGSCTSIPTHQLTLDTIYIPHKQAFIFDGRNIMDHEALRKIGFEVYAIGKPRTKEW